jgi:GntR family transcriptional regulator, rspAB operon transcriptional repressor
MFPLCELPGYLHTSMVVCKGITVKASTPLATASSPLAPVGRVRTQTRASDRVYSELVAAIRDLRLPPGASLSETELAEKLHVSRTPLREAIARLVENGLVSVVPQVGTRVELIRLHDVEEARFVRENLELAAFEAACLKAERDVRVLRGLLEEQERSHRLNDLDGFFAADEALHAQIFALSGYPGAWQAVQRMKLQLDRLRRLSLPEASTVRVLIDEHTAIVDALEAGDVSVGRQHISRHARRVLDHGPTLRAKYPDYFTERA